MSKTINKAMADLVLGLGADPSVLSDNSTVSDYIEDLAGAIKGETEALIDDSEASETKTYSSSKIDTLTAKELPTVNKSNNCGQFLSVSTSGKWNVKDAFVDLTLSTSNENNITLLESGAIINKASFLRVNIVGTLYYFYKSKTPQATTTPVEWINISRETGKTVIRSFSIDNSDVAYSQQIPVTKVEIADPT